MTGTAVKKGNHGPNVRRWREWLDMPLETLAEKIKVSPITLSDYEKQDILEQEVLENISGAFNVPVAAITEIGDDASINIVANKFDNSSSALQYKCSFNSIDKVTELYERLLKVEQEKVSLLQEVLLKDKK